MPSSVQSNLFPQNVAQTWETFSPSVAEVPSPHLTFAGLILFQNGFTDDPEKSHCTKWCNCWIPAVCGEQEKSCRINPALERSTNPCKSTQVQHQNWTMRVKNPRPPLLCSASLAPKRIHQIPSPHQSWCVTDGTNSAGYIVVNLCWTSVRIKIRTGFVTSGDANNLKPRIDSIAVSLLVEFVKYRIRSKSK